MPPIGWRLFAKGKAINMAIGPVQLLALGFSQPDFHGEIIAELERLRESNTVRIIDALAVYKDAAGELEVEHLSNLSEQQAIEIGSKMYRVARVRSAQKLPMCFVECRANPRTMAMATAIPAAAEKKL